MRPVLGHKELYANDTHGQAVRDEQTQVVEPCRHYPIVSLKVLIPINWLINPRIFM